MINTHNQKAKRYVKNLWISDNPSSKYNSPKIPVWSSPIIAMGVFEMIHTSGNFL